MRFDEVELLIDAARSYIHRACWLAVHREVRTSQRIRAVYDFLARELPHVI